MMTRMTKRYGIWSFILISLIVHVSGFAPKIISALLPDPSSQTEPVLSEEERLALLEAQELAASQALLAQREMTLREQMQQSFESIAEDVDPKFLDEVWEQVEENITEQIGVLMGLFIDKLLEAGWSMIPLALCSVVSIAVMIERFFSLRRANILDSDLVHAVAQSVKKGDYQAAQKSAQQSTAVFGTIVDKAVDAHLIESTEWEQSLNEASSRELPKLEKFLDVLAVIGSIAPLLGLFGTVYGMIVSFDVIANESVNKEAMAGGISLALITTGAGLMIAIAAIVANNYFRARVEGYYRLTEEAILDITRAYHLARPATVTPETESNAKK